VARRWLADDVLEAVKTRWSRCRNLLQLTRSALEHEALEVGSDVTSTAGPANASEQSPRRRQMG
jgi:hypothetical protein